MHTNEIEVLKPGRPGLALAEIPETAAAVAEIETAHATLAAAYKATLQKMNERRNRQEIGVDCARAESAEWREFQAGPLRTFHAVREETARMMLFFCEENLAAEAAGVREREAGIARGLGTPRVWSLRRAKMTGQAAHRCQDVRPRSRAQAAAESSRNRREAGAAPC